MSIRVLLFMILVEVFVIGCELAFVCDRLQQMNPQNIDIDDDD